MKIESLTKAQQKRMTEFRDKWLRYGLCTDPADRKMSESGIAKAYKAAKKVEPKRIVWCQSPMSGALTRAIVIKHGAKIGASVWASVRASVWDSVRASVGDSVWDSVGASVWASVGDSVWDSVGASVRASVWASVGDSVRDSVGDSVWDSVGASVWDSVRDSVWDSVRASVGDSVRDSVRDSVGAAGYGQHDANWIGFYNYFREVCELKEITEPLQGLTEVTMSSGWFWPHETICWMTDRPNLLKQDNRNRLHNDSGPALQYRDGWSIYAVHGVRLPEYIIERPKEITSEKIEKENNAEIRRLMIDKFGKDRYIKESGAKQIAKDDFGILWEKELTGDEPLTMVEVLNSTAEPDGSFKTYFLRVNRECRPLLDDQKMGNPQKRTPLNAIASTFGKTGEEYLLEQQT